MFRRSYLFCGARNLCGEDHFALYRQIAYDSLVHVTHQIDHTKITIITTIHMKVLALTAESIDVIVVLSQDYEVKSRSNQLNVMQLSFPVTFS
jgi:hypothetical protein